MQFHCFAVFVCAEAASAENCEVPLHCSEWVPTADCRWQLSADPAQLGTPPDLVVSLPAQGPRADHDPMRRPRMPAAWRSPEGHASSEVHVAEFSIGSIRCRTQCENAGTQIAFSSGCK